MKLCQVQACMESMRQNTWIASTTLCARMTMATHSNGLQIIPKRQERLWHCFCDCGLIQQETYQHAMLQDNRSRRYGMIICEEYLPPSRTTNNHCVRQRSTVHLCILRWVLQDLGSWTETVNCLSCTNRWAGWDSQSTHYQPPSTIHQPSSRWLGRSSATYWFCRCCITIQNHRRISIPHWLWLWTTYIIWLGTNQQTTSLGWAD